jgi:hypothetical protein
MGVVNEVKGESERESERKPDYISGMYEATMLYIYPGRWELEPGDFYDYIIVDGYIAGEIDKKISEGWRLTISEAKSLYEKNNAEKKLSK